MSNNFIITNETKVDLRVSYGTLVTSNKVQLVQFTTIVETIKTGTNGLIDKIEKIRACQNDEEKRQLKRSLLPYFSMGTFHNGIRKNDALQSINHIILDLDHLGDPNAVSEMKKKLSEDNLVFCCFTSPSGDGLKVIYQLETDIADPTVYSKIYGYNATTISKQYCFETDTTSDSARACFMSFDPDIYVNPRSTPLSISCPIILSGKKNKLLHSLTGTTKGHRNTKAAQLVGVYMNSGFDQEFAIEHLKLWNQNNKPPLPDEELTKLVVGMYERYKDTATSLPVQFVVKNNSYYRKADNKVVTTFTITPNELLVLDDTDCLRCDITSQYGYKYKDINLENTDWHSKTKLLKAVGHQDCTFHGSDNDVQALCSYVNANVPVRKKGTKVIGLIDGRWVTKEMNITSSGISTDPEIVPYAKGTDAFYHGIVYPQLSDTEYQGMVTTLYGNILNINEHKVILPWLAWTLATPLKPILMKSLTAFPLVFVHGSQGSGKTTTGKMFKRLSGYTVADPTSCTQKTFPMLKLLSSTNAIPVILDEYKASDMRDDEVDTLLRYMRRTYAGEVESKGRPDQTVEDYSLQAPLTVMGEWNISQPAIKERILMVRFSDHIKKSKAMQEAFHRLWNVPLEGFMPRFIEFCLNQDIEMLVEQSVKTVKTHFQNITVATRILLNLSVMVLGTELFKTYGTHCKVNVPAFDIGLLLDDQLKEITGTANGLVESAVDQLVEELSVMAQMGKLRKDEDYRLAKIDMKDSLSLEVLAVRFNKIFPMFKVHAQQTKYEGDLLDKNSYMKLFDDCDYVVGKNHIVKFEDKTHRCLCIEIAKAKAQGLDLEGFER